METEWKPKYGDTERSAQEQAMYDKIYKKILTWQLSATNMRKAGKEAIQERIKLDKKYVLATAAKMFLSIRKEASQGHLSLKWHMSPDTWCHPAMQERIARLEYLKFQIEYCNEASALKISWVKAK